MPDPMVLRTLAGISSALGLLACLAYLFVLSRSRGAERSAREVIGESSLFNAVQVIEIIDKFKSDDARLKALVHFTDLDRDNAEALLEKIKADISVGELRVISMRRDAVLSLIGGLTLLLFGVLGLVAASGQHKFPDPSTATAAASHSVTATANNAPQTQTASRSTAVAPGQTSPAISELAEVDPVGMWHDARPGSHLAIEILRSASSFTVKQLSVYDTSSAAGEVIGLFDRDMSGAHHFVGQHMWGGSKQPPGRWGTAGGLVIDMVGPNTMRMVFLDSKYKGGWTYNRTR